MLLTVKQAADALGISLALAYNLCQQKRIRHERHGLRRGVIRIPEDAIDEYRQSVTIEAEPAEYRPAKTKTYKHLKP
jgi:excisionase family DNA binding protein